MLLRPFIVWIFIFLVFSLAAQQVNEINKYRYVVIEGWMPEDNECSDEFLSKIKGHLLRSQVPLHTSKAVLLSNMVPERDILIATFSGALSVGKVELRFVNADNTVVLSLPITLGTKAKCSTLLQKTDEALQPFNSYTYNYVGGKLNNQSTAVVLPAVGSLKGNGEELEVDSQINAVGRYYALIIAVQQYNAEDNRIQNLDFPVSDANLFAAALRKGYTFDSIRIMINPSKSEIMRVLLAYRLSLGENDNFLMFYSGHGYWDKDNEQGYWLPANATMDDPSTWISNSDIKDQIKPMKCIHTLLVSDACFSGGIFKTREANLSGATKTVQELYKVKSRKAMTSGALTTVPDKSVFLKYMLDALNGNTTAYLSSERLFYSFKENAINNSLSDGLIPQFGVIADTDDKGGDFIFVKKIK